MTKKKPRDSQSDAQPVVSPSESESARSKVTKVCIVLNGLAAIMMFASWYWENVFADDRTETLERMSHSIQMLGTENGIASQNLLAYQNALKDKDVPENYLANTARSWADRQENAMVISTHINPKSSLLSEHLHRFRSMHSDLKKLIADESDIEELKSLALVMMIYVDQIKHQAKDEWSNEMQRLQRELDADIATWQRLFIGSSIVAAITWLIGQAPRLVDDGVNDGRKASTDSR
jgi:hypothetical protein